MWAKRRHHPSSVKSLRCYAHEQKHHWPPKPWKHKSLNASIMPTSALTSRRLPMLNPGRKAGVLNGFPPGMANVM